MSRPDPLRWPTSVVIALAASGLRRVLLGVACLVLVAMAGQLHGATASITSVTVGPPVPTVIGLGSTVSIIVAFNEAVDADASASFTLNSGGVATITGAVTGAGATSLTFTYTVGATDVISTAPFDLDVSTGSTLAVGDVIAVTSADEPVSWTWPNGSTIVDSSLIRLGPQAVSVFTNGTNPDNITSGTVSFTVTYSEPVVAVTAGDFTTVATGMTSATIGTPTMSNAQTAVVPVTFSLSGTAGTLGLSVTGGQDPAGNQLVSGTPVPNQTYSFDATAPTVTSLSVISASPTSGYSGHVVEFQAVFSQAVSAPTTANLQLAGSIASSVATIAAVGAAPSAIYDITLNPLAAGTGTGTVNLTVVPGAGTLLNSFGTAVGAISSVASATIDQTKPAVSSVSVVSANPSNGKGANVPVFQVVYSKPVTNVTTSDFTVSLGATPPTIASITPASGFSSVYTVTLNQPTISGTLTLTASGVAGISDAEGNTAAGTSSQNGTCTIDQVAPLVSAITTTSPTPTTGQGTTPITFQVAFSEPVTGVAVGSFSASVTGSVGASTVSSVSPSAATSSAVFTVTVTVPNTAASGSVGLSFATTGITDAYGNALVATVPSTDQTYAIDQVHPTLTSIAATNASPTTGAGSNALQFLATFSVPVANVVAADFTATLNSSTFTATSVSAITSSVYLVTFASLPGGAGTVGTYTATVAAVNGVTDALGNTLVGSYPTASYQIDQQHPTLVSLVPSNASPTSGTGANALQFLATFSVPVVNVNAANFSAVFNSGTYIATSVATVGSNAVYLVTFPSLAAGTATGTYIASAVATGITDALGNTLTAPTATGSYQISQAQPVISSVVITGANPSNGLTPTLATFQVTFSEAVTGVAAANFAANASGVPLPTITVSPSPTSLSAVYTVTMSLSNTGASGTLGLSIASLANITDALGNALAASTPSPNQSYTIDQVQPTVSSITTLSANPGTAQLQFQVQFSSAVSGLTAADFTAQLQNGLSANASASVASIAPSSGLSSQFTVTLSGLTATAPASGTLGIAFTTATGVKDALGNAASTAAPGTNQAYTITPPSIISVSTVDPNPNPAPGPVTFLVVFSTPVSGFTAANFPFAVSSSITAIGAPTVAVVSPTSCTVQVGGIHLATGVFNTNLGLAFLGTAGGGIRDALGNIASSTLPASNNTVYTITTEQPLVSLQGQPDIFQEGATVTPIQVFTCTNFVDAGGNFVTAGQQGTIDATVFIPNQLAVAPLTVSSDPEDALSITPSGGTDPYSVTGLATNPGVSSSGTLMVAGAAVGTFTYTYAQGNLHIVLTGVTTPADVVDLINDIDFSNPGNNPSNSGRQVFLSVTDGSGKSSASYTQNITVSLYNNSLALIAGVPEINTAPKPRIVPPGQSILSQHILTNDVDSFFVTSVFSTSNVKMTPVNAATSLTVPTAKGSVTISLYGDWSYTANAGATGEDSFVLNIMDIGPGEGQYVGGDALLAPVNVTYEVFIVPSNTVTSLSPSITSNPPVEAELGSSFDYAPTSSEVIDPSLATNFAFDLIDLDSNGFVAAGDFVIDPTTGEVTATTVPNSPDGYIRFAILYEVTDTSGVTRGTYQPVVLKVVSSTSGGG